MGRHISPIYGIDNSHEILHEFPSTLKIVDEFYWNLHEKKKGVCHLAQVRVGPPDDSRGPVPLEKLSRHECSVIWTHLMDQGRIYCNEHRPQHFQFLRSRVENHPLSSPGLDRPRKGGSVHVARL
ncbi:MAG: hypothetical protein M2R45_04500 [Verrucomicrobia subdivision 3 bacterium]|nr:hypothetical protein [Limisphaerales bacterium]MCS1412656.1 hypothetical protein [Limisphaerales bacterium]